MNAKPPSLFRKFAARALLAASMALFAPAHAALADAPALFKELAGSWHGLGDLTLSDGARERVSCNGYYVLKSAGQGISVAILCKSPNYEIELRTLVHDRGGSLSGTWEERTYHATGKVSGQARDSRVDMSISGTIEGSVSMALKGRRQTVKISTDGTAFKTFSISLVRG